jgi:hypothetical protein
MLDLRGYHEPRVERDKHQALLTGGPGRVPGVSLQFRPYAEYAHVYDSNPRGTFDAENAVRYRMNRHGFRGDDISRAKPDGVARVMLLGDSFAFGAGVPLEDTLGFQLEGLLNAGKKPDTQVVTFAIGGWGTRDEILFLEHQGMDFEPDLVVVVYVLNDAGYAGGLDLWREFREQYQNRRLKWSYLASSLYATVARRTLARQYIADLVEISASEREKWKESLSYLSRGQRLARARGAEFAVVIFRFLFDLDEGYPFHSLHQMVVTYCMWNGIPVLDLFGAFEGRDYADLWVHPSDQHPNEQGHRIAAHALSGFIANEGLLLRGPSSVRP